MLRGHSDRVWCCRISPDAAFAVSASADFDLKIWDLAAGTERATFRGHRNGLKACAVSPDARLVVSTGDDRALRVWDVSSGEQLIELRLAGGVLSLALHPWQPLAVCGDAGGNLSFLELIGIEYGPLVVTAVEGPEGLELRCPACRQTNSLAEQQLGSELVCPNAGCGRNLRSNEFVIRRTS